MRYLSNAVHILGGCTLRTREKLVSEGAVRGAVSVGNAEKRKFAVKQLQVEKGQISTKLTSRALAPGEGLGLTLETPVL